MHGFWCYFIQHKNIAINPSANVFLFGYFNVDHKDRPTYSGGTYHGELCYIFPILNDLTQMVNFPTQIPGCESPAQFSSFGFICFFWH